MELKKTRKKALALVLAACVTGTSSTPVFAAEDLFTDTPVVETPDFGTEAASSVKKDVTIIYTCNGEEIKRDRVTINDDKKSITVDYINSLPSKYGLGLPDGYVFIEKEEFDINGNECYVEVRKKIQETGYLQFSGEGMEAVQTEVKLGTTVPLMDFLGKVPEGKVFAGWTLNGKKVYAAGESFTFDKALAQDMGTSADGVQGYLFSFKANFEDAKATETGYLQFEGMDNFVEVELGSTLPLMNYHGEVPEGKVFAGWTLNGKKVYAAGENFTFDKALAQDMGTSADGVQGYLFSFKASFEDAKVNEAGYIQFSGEGMETVQTEVKLGTTVPLMNFLGKVPEGKVFAGWTLDGKKVYAAGENFTFDKALAQDMGTNADGVQGYLFSFKAAFDASEKKINVVFKTKTGNVISNKAMMVPYTEKYVDASNLTAPKGYKLVSEGNLRIVGDNVTAIVTKISSSVSRKKISTLSFRGVAAAYEQTGKQIRPRVTIKDGRKVLKLNKDYTITYKNNIKRGRASIIIKGKNNYYGTKTITFRIVSKGLR